MPVVSKNTPLIVVSSGEPAGIGPDIALALAARRFAARLAVLGDLNLLRSRAKLLGSRVELVACSEPGDVAPHEPGRLGVLPIALPARAEPGKLDTRNAPYVLAMLRRGAELCVAGAARALVTAPVQKSVITQSGVPFSGHTELLAELTGAPQPVMLLAGKSLRVALATTHLPLRAVAAALDRAKLESLIRIVHRDLTRRFRIERPRDRKSTRLNSSHSQSSYAVFCLKKKNKKRSSAAQISTTSARCCSMPARDSSAPRRSTSSRARTVQCRRSGGRSLPSTASGSPRN